STHTVRAAPTSSPGGEGWASSPSHGNGPRSPPAAQAGPAAAPRDHSEADALVTENARLRQRLDALALDLARREGEAQASAWAIAELERRLEDRSEAPRVPLSTPGRPPAAPAVTGGPDPELATVLEELDILRRALAQEHAARLQAESGEELARARKEIARQAELLAELRGRPHEDPPRGAPQA
ncbi:MAG: hypothetical protein JOZ69_18750, partial [Myxococcales bacterium]|nr:hypothetical protein [Myxococcales bacterium]